MSNFVVKHPGGLCPYCGAMAYTTEEEIREDRKAMFCSLCDQWSVRTPRGSQFPLDDPTDQYSAPAHRVLLP